MLLIVSWNEGCIELLLKRLLSLGDECVAGIGQTLGQRPRVCARVEWARNHAAVAIGLAVYEQGTHAIALAENVKDINPLLNPRLTHS